MERRACLDGPTRSMPNNMEECVECGTCVRHDLVDHPFFGFKNGCQRLKQTSAHTEQLSAREENDG